MGAYTKQSIYAIYDDEELPIAVGTIKELAKYLGVSISTIYRAMERDGLINSKYKAYYVFDEIAKEKTCVICGKTKPLKDFAIASCKNGKRIYRNYCKVCYNNKFKKKRRERLLQNDSK